MADSLSSAGLALHNFSCPMPRGVWLRVLALPASCGSRGHRPVVAHRVCIGFGCDAGLDLWNRCWRQLSQSFPSANLQVAVHESLVWASVDVFGRVAIVLLGVLSRYDSP